MNKIRCEKNCVHQKDGWCSVETGIKMHKNEDHCAFLTEQKEKTDHVSRKNSEENENYF